VVDHIPQLNTDRVAALTQAYTQTRALADNEIAAWPTMLQLAALRFWLSRQQYALQHHNQPDVLIKDPDYFRHLLKTHYLNARAQ
jgi:homoserine kinase type II